MYVVAYSQRQTTLQSGDVSGEFNFFNGTGFDSVDISPTGAITNCGGPDCGPVNTADLTFNGSNAAAFKTAVDQAMRNGLFNAGYTDYFLISGVQGNQVRFRLYNKINGTNFVYYNNLAGSSAPSVQDLILRGGSGVATGVGGYAKYQADPFDTGVDPFDCSYTSQCGALSTSQSLGFTGTSAFPYGVWSINTVTIGGSADTAACSHAELVATLSGASCDGVFSWSGPGTINNPTNQTIYVTTPGTYEVDVTGCTGCGTLEDSETVV